MTLIYSVIASPLAQMVAQKSGDTAQKTGSFQAYGMWILIAVMIAVFYFLLIRPQRKRAQQHDEMLSELKKGDEAVTIGGIHGVVKRITADTVVLEVDKGVRITFSKSAISRKISAEEEEEEEEEEVEEEVEEEPEEEFEEEPEDE